MPAVTQGAPSSSGLIEVKLSDTDYRYPFNLDLRPGSDLSQKIVTMVMQMADAGHERVSKRYEKWNEIDRTLKVFIPLSEYEKTVKARAKARGEVRPLSVVVPYSYATLETLLAYKTKAFLADTTFQYEGCGPEDTIGAKLLELTVNQQVRRFKSQLDIHTGMRDGLGYGIGLSTLNWAKRYGKRPSVQEMQEYSLFGSTLSSKKEKINVDALLFEGNEVISIDPYRCLIDPNVSAHNIQSGEFVGWLEFQRLNKLLSEEAAGGYFNITKLHNNGNYAFSKYSCDQSERIVKKENTDRNRTGATNYVTLIHMYATIIPKKLGLPGTLSNNKNGEYPEIWLFSLANDAVVVRAMPLGLNHGMYPVVVNAPDYDGYSTTPLARMELVGGLQTTLDWLFNSHIANVRKAINDMFVVDPSLINMEDMEDPEPGKLIKLKRSAWGRGVQGAVEQLKTMDVTRGNITDADFVMSIMQKSSAATDATMGIMREGGERRSASEFSGTMQMAISRLEHLARITSLQYIQDLAYFHASHTQQLMSQEVYVKAVGDWPEVLLEEFEQRQMLGQAVKVSPFDILVDFDIIFKDGSHAAADAIENDFWTKSFQVIGTQPELMQKLDVARIFMHMARINGAKNVRDFVRKGGDVNAVTASNGAVADQVNRGNLIDMATFMRETA